MGASVVEGTAEVGSHFQVVLHIHRGSRPLTAGRHRRSVVAVVFAAPDTSVVAFRDIPVGERIGAGILAELLAQQSEVTVAEDRLHRTCPSVLPIKYEDFATCNVTRLLAH